MQLQKVVFTGNKQKMKVNKGYNIIKNKVTGNGMMRHVMLKGRGLRGTHSCVVDVKVALVMRLLVCSSDP